MRLIYTLLLIVASPLLLYSLYKKKVGKPAFGARWKEHWGMTPKLVLRILFGYMRFPWVSQSPRFP